MSSRSRAVSLPRSAAFAAAILIGALFSAPALDAAPLSDGPYVTQSADGTWTSRSIFGDDTALQVVEREVKVGDDIQIPAVGRVTAFTVNLRRPPRVPDPDEVKLKRTTPLFVMADTHGEYEIAVQLLRAQRVIDDKLGWSFGKGHFVVTGDVFDRGPHQTEIFWLLYKLEAEAKRAGGALHLLLGNHESMAMGGDERYLHPKYPQVREVLGARNYSELWNEHTLLGRWLRTKATVLKIGDYLAVHGGISRETVDRRLTLAQMNAEVRNTLGAMPKGNFVRGNEGPQWYRGYFPEATKTTATSEDVDAALAFYGVKSILVGHTIVDTVKPLFGGRVIAVQVYPHIDERTGRPVMEALRVENGKFFRARIDGTREPLNVPDAVAIR
jgi:hypothetical protein